MFKNLVSLILTLAINYTPMLTQQDSVIQYQTLKFKYILETAKKNYKDSVDLKGISEAAYKAMLKELDPFSEYFSTDVYQNYKNNYYSDQKTCGLVLLSINDTLVVYSVSEGSPADSAGISKGDKIIYLSGSSAIKTTTAQAYEKLNSQESKPVNFVIKRINSNNLFEYTLIPKEIEIKSIVTSFIIPDTKIGFIKSNRIALNADKEFRNVISKLIKKGAESFLLDFRSNQGGSVEQAANIVDEFIYGDKLIVDVKGINNKFSKKYYSKEGQIAENYPVIFLVDEKTVSAGELIVGAIQDLDRGIIVGTSTYGKGMAQKVFEFIDTSAFRLTIGDYYTASGRNIQKPYVEDVNLDPAINFNMSEKNVKNLENLLKKSGGKGYLPIYHTASGRVVLGGGGIYPDSIVKTDTTTSLTKYLISNGFIIQFVFNNYLPFTGKIIEKYNNDIYKFAESYFVDDTILKYLENFSRGKNIWNDTMFVKDKEYLRNYVKSMIGYLIWGNDAFYIVDMKFDNQIKKAIESMNDAKKIFKN